ncbi:winged helix DNA-binding protein [Diaminobutyricimonas aerilata]|uniref:Winged helix DNA-binding protein n=1 Tax=Diaminobutyricimonas aerilata TaxID=1162967 RepID=A0A2M9CM71_9MICO|nr:transcriptional regulator [Diaminobutyricimonas aerilata]PJJ72992.1 winged helix DNA-binding protein [Diaminobutyricimonas aerilata]
MTSPVAPAFNEVIHAPIRLRICALLRRVDELEFAVVRDALQVTDATLSKNTKVLGDAGLLTVRKERSPARADARRLTWLALTAEGRTALESHLAALGQIAESSPTPAQ